MSRSERERRELHAFHDGELSGWRRRRVARRLSRDPAARRELEATRRPVPADELVTLGISCESCHFGGREHAVEEREIRFVPTSPMMTIRHPASGEPAESDRHDPFVINSICAQCHNATLDFYPDGSPAVNSNESINSVGWFSPASTTPSFSH